MLHPNVIGDKEITPSLSDLHSDISIPTPGIRSAEQTQDEAQALFDEMAMADIDAQGNDEWCAESALLDVYHRYGRAAFNAVLVRAERKVIAEEARSLQASTAKVVNAVRDYLSADPNVNRSLVRAFA